MAILMNRTLMIALIVLITGACGFQQREDESEDEKETPIAIPVETSESHTISGPATPLGPVRTPVVGITESEAAPDLVDVQVTIIDGRTAALVGSVESASAYSIYISSCVSGYDANFTLADSNHQLYRGDGSCDAQLTSFDLDSNSWLKVGGGDCGGAATTTCTFENTLDANDTLTVTIDSQLAGTITDSEQITFTITEVVDSGDEILQAAEIHDGSVGITVQGDRAPYTDTMVSSLLMSIDATDGNGTFQFEIECKATVDSAVPTARVCNGQSMNTYDINLVPDIWSGSLTAVNAATIFDNQALDGYLDIVAGDTVAAADANLTLGGLRLSLEGPATMYDNRAMILIIKYQNSYRYWEVDVGNLADPNDI